MPSPAAVGLHQTHHRVLGLPRGHRLGVVWANALSTGSRQAPLSHCMRRVIAVGHEDGIEPMPCDNPVFRMVLDRRLGSDALCSHSTASRPENRHDVRALVSMGRTMVVSTAAPPGRCPGALSWMSVTRGKHRASSIPAMPAFQCWSTVNRHGSRELATDHPGDGRSARWFRWCARAARR